MSRIETTDRILEEAASGQEEAFDLLYARFAGRLERYVAGRLRGRAALQAEPEDIVQEVFAEIFTSLGRFQPRGKGTFYRLLVTIARRRMIDLERRMAARPEGRRADPTAEAGSGGLELAARSPRTGPLTRLLQLEDQELCRRAFQALPEGAREIIRLRLVEERSAGEISRLTGKSVGAVWVWFHRAMRAWYAAFEALRRR
ncbi:MAG: RNA polymerase sigma factor [Thermoanaerobaculia bacterium]